MPWLMSSAFLISARAAPSCIPRSEARSASLRKSDDQAYQNSFLSSAFCHMPDRIDFALKRSVCKKRKNLPVWRPNGQVLILKLSQMLVAVNSVVEIIQNRLHGCGKFHIKVEVIGRKGNGEKCSACKRQFFATVQSLDILPYLLSITMIPRRGGSRASGQPALRP